MSALFPNLTELLGTLDPGTDAHALALAFDSASIDGTRSELRRIVAEWEISVGGRDVVDREVS